MWGRLFKKKPLADPSGNAKLRLDEFPEDGDGTDEWAFLREQPDHDADEMSNVRRRADEGSAQETPASFDGPFSAAPLGLDGPAPVRAKIGSAPVLDLPAVVANGRPLRVLALRVMSSAGEHVRRLDSELLIGRNLEKREGRAEIDLAGDTGVDQRHALIHREDGHFLLRDLHSAGGTWLNGRLLDPETDAWLKPGDQIELGISSHLLVTEAPADPNLTEEDLLLADILHGALGGDEVPVGQPVEIENSESDEPAEPDFGSSGLPQAGFARPDGFSGSPMARVAHSVQGYSRTAFSQPGYAASERASWLH